jgi:flagellum-specific peptidoglycan hydrolase FlgJ
MSIARRKQGMIPNNHHNNGMTVTPARHVRRNMEDIRQLVQNLESTAHSAQEHEEIGHSLLAATAALAEAVADMAVRLEQYLGIKE